MVALYKKWDSSSHYTIDNYEKSHLCHSYCHTQSNRETLSNPRSHKSFYTCPNSYAQSHCNAFANSNYEAYCNSNSDSKSNAYSYTFSESYPLFCSI